VSWRPRPSAARGYLVLSMRTPDGGGAPCAVGVRSSLTEGPLQLWVSGPLGTQRRQLIARGYLVLTWVSGPRQGLVEEGGEAWVSGPRQTEPRGRHVGIRSATVGI
jgi:hypothetical protein